jgi:glycosyltransferase involved in cell wall biosynthesis
MDSLNSVLRQTCRDFEVIVVDDNSSDGTGDLVSSLEDARIRLISHETNLGAGAARNTGIRAATGDFVAFHDSDDEWLPTKLDKQLAELNRRGADWIGIYSGLLIVRDVVHREGARLQLRYVPDVRLTHLQGDIFHSLIEDSFVSTQTLLVRHHALLAVGEFDETLPALEDWDYTLRLAQLGNLAFIDEPLVLQRFSPDSITRSERRRVEARVSIFEKNRPAIADFPALLCHHCFEIAGGYRIVGEYDKSIIFLWKCVRLQPLHIRYWMTAVYTYMLKIKTEIMDHFSRASDKS